MAMLTRWYVRVIAADRGFLVFMAVAPFLLGALIHLLVTSQGLAGPPRSNNNAETILLLFVICACLSGTANSTWELVKERQIYIRERAAGLSSGAYLASKLVVLGVISVVQSAVLVLTGLAGVKIPSPGAFLTGVPLIELLLGVAAMTVASMCLGLLMSSLVSTSERAILFLALLTVSLVILSGGLLALGGKTGLSQVAWLAPSRWGFSAMASTVNLNFISPFGAITDPLWTQTPGTWLRDMGVLVGLAALFTLLTWIRLRRLSPRRRW